MEYELVVEQAARTRQPQIPRRDGTFGAGYIGQTLLVGACDGMNVQLQLSSADGAVLDHARTFKLTLEELPEGYESVLVPGAMKLSSQGYVPDDGPTFVDEPKRPWEQES